jgi:hypothetical protein
VAAERGRPGTSSWKLQRAARHGQIQGYADRVSVLPGQTFSLMVSTVSPHFTVAAYRFGAYKGGLARRVWTSPPERGTVQPKPVLVPATHTVVAHWTPSLSVRTTRWPPGAYLLKLTAADGFQAYVPMIIRSPSAAGRVALVAPVATWEAYNAWGGYSLYTAPPGQRRSWAVSFDRPYQAPGASAFLYNVVPVVVRAERLGIPLAYLTNVDLQSDRQALKGATAYVSLGHNEYWTTTMRARVTQARDAGTNLVFIGANTMYWRIRLAPAPSGPDRLVIGYKTDATSADPDRFRHPAQTTARFRDPPDPDPENSLTGMLYECFPVDAPYRVVSPHWWGFRGTGVHAGTSFPHLVGVEADRVYPIPSTPRPLQILSYAVYSCGGFPTSAESVYYTTPSGAGVFNTGTLLWICALNPACQQGPFDQNTRRFVARVTDTVLRTFAAGPAGLKHPAHDNVARFNLSPTNQVPAS